MAKLIKLPALPFESNKKFTEWLAKNHDKSAGVWIDTISTPLNLTSVPALPVP
ncbi:MAG: hypothetical protein IH589_07055 [Anaerolineales bacterium]|nr:hypothetical protein [Anaerolineales bacterium]